MSSGSPLPLVPIPPKSGFATFFFGGRLDNTHKHTQIHAEAESE